MSNVTCGVFIFDEEGKILIGHITGATRGPGGWSIPKGLADPGEDYKNAAIREVWEETGIIINVNRVSDPIAEVKYKTKEKTLVAFEVFLNGSELPETLVCDSMFTDKKTGKQHPEIDDYKWLDPTDAVMLMHETQLEALSKCSYLDTYENLEIFDFDGTLMDTLSAETGPVEYEKVTGIKYPHIGWWSKPESLDPKLPFRKFKAASTALNSYTEDTVKIIVTNRIKTLIPEITSTLVQYNIDRYVNNIICSTGSLTKPQRVERLVAALKITGTITVWEDREDQITEYISYGKILGLPVKINIVSQDDVVAIIEL